MLLARNRFKHLICAKFLTCTISLQSSAKKLSQEIVCDNNLNQSDVKYGQPTHFTHNYLIKEDEITPLITRSEYQKRRQNLMDLVVSTTAAKFNQHLIVIPSAVTQYMSDKIPYVFRQNTDFLYLSGCLEPNSCLVLLIDNLKSPKLFKSIIFMPEKNSHAELWDGPRTGHEKAAELFGTNNSLPMTEFENFMCTYMKVNSKFLVWYEFMNPTAQNDVHNIMRKLLNDKKDKLWEPIKQLCHRLRLIKSDSEIQLMQKTCDIASDAIRNTIAFSKPGINEHQINAKVDYECRIAGAQYLAYPPVIAGGDRANVIHYIINNQIVSENELVLMDAGCEYHGYTSDITRTWPISGSFTEPQKQIYEIVLNVQKELIKKCKPSYSLDDLFEEMCVLIANGLQDINLLPKSLSINDKKNWGYKFCPHHVSHYLGMDVHDTPTIDRNVKLKPGMVVTVEPGIYIRKDELSLPKEYRGIGIRIEDDILVTNNEPIILSVKCPKEVDDVEKVSKTRSKEKYNIF